MHFNRRTFAGFGLFLLGGAAAVAVGMQSARKPTVVVTVNLSAVLEGLDERAEASKRMRKMADEMTADDKTQKDELTKMQEDLKAMNEAAGERAALEEKIYLAALNHQAWGRFSTDKLDIEQALSLQDLYQKIKEAVAEMSKAQGFDLVLVNDSLGEIRTTADSRVTREAQVSQQIAARQLLYANQSTLDITDELITRMNNAFNAKAAPKSQN